MKSDNVVLGWVSLNYFLQVIKGWFSAAEPYFAPVLTLCQIAVAIATVVWIVYKIRAARKLEKLDDE